jgi:hypothetical protein
MVKNLSVDEEGINMVVAIVGIPAGLEARSASCAS